MLAQMHPVSLNRDPFQGLQTSSQYKISHNSLRYPETLSKSKSRTKKGNFFGIEVVEVLQWSGWELGIETTKTLTLKNVNLKPQKLLYSALSTKFFTTLFPQPIILNAGMSYALPITFLPLEKRTYEDSITFETTDGSFSVVLQAVLPRHDITMPSSLTLPICAVYNSSEASFTMYNTSKLQTNFTWSVPDPFTVIPNSGMLQPGSECKIKVLFQPQVAMVVEEFAICTFRNNGENEKRIHLQAIAKYPHLLVRVPGKVLQNCSEEETQYVLHFGSVPVGGTMEKYIEIQNVTPVTASFRIERKPSPSQLDSTFFCDVRQAVASANGMLQIPIQFRPRTVGAHSVDYFYLIPAGNITKTVLKVTGYCKGPLVSLQHEVVNFGCVHFGDSVVQSLQIKNASDVPAFYQFDIDCSESVFFIDRPCGYLPEDSSVALKIAFQPTNPINYYRRVACLVHHQDPLFLDLIGTCHSNDIEPAILQPKHLWLYRVNMARGLTFYPSDLLSDMLQKNKIQLDANGALQLFSEDIEGKGPEMFPQTEPMSEYFDDHISNDISMFPPHVSADIKEYNFGDCSQHLQGEPVPLQLTNHTKGKITISWNCPVTSPFSVVPATSDIPPLKSMAFRITFKPSKLNTLYGAELEGFAFYKIQRDHHNIVDGTFCPPWCITIRVTGHTFQTGTEHFVPKYMLDSSKVVFPAVNLEDASYRSVLLYNSGELPISFSIDQRRCPAVIVKPTMGFMVPGAHRIFLLKTVPNEPVVQKHILPIQLNASEKYTQELVLLSRSEVPSLSLQGGGKLFCKPTCIGSVSKHFYVVKNVTRLPLHFEWKISQADSQIISVHPPVATIQPNELLTSIWSFTPLDEKKYILKPSVLVWGTGMKHCSAELKKTQLHLRFIGEGSTSTIAAENSSLDLGNVMVGSLHSCDIVLMNNGNCTLNFTLNIEQSITGPCDPDEVLSDPVALELEHYDGTIPARSKIIVRATARPARRVHYTWTITYHVVTSKVLNNTLQEKQELCNVTAEGIFPTLTIADAHTTGSAAGISKMQLWKLFSLETLISYLERDPTPNELIYRVPTRHSTRRCPSVFTPVMLDFNFGAASTGAEPSVVLLLLENKGVLPVDWAFLYPSDQQIELEYWAESGEFDSEELHQMRIQDNQLFSITPKVGHLLPGQEITVKLAHRHDFVGTDRFPVLLKVSHGREILLNFIGVTVEKERHYVHFHSTKHVFEPVPIGSSSPPKQIYELYNGGSVPVVYEILLEPLWHVQEENFQHPIFQCLNPRGGILPGMTAHIEWIFSPLEAKTYSVDIPIHILGGDSALITFEGIGYDQSALGSRVPHSNFLSSHSAPVTQRLPLPGQVVFFSEEQLSFGNLPVYSRSSRIIFLKNKSDREHVSFTWHAALPGIEEVLEIAPVSGTLQPKESAPCIVTLQSSGKPGFYSMELICEVYNQRELALYQQESMSWEEERERRKVEFTITDKQSETDSQNISEASSGSETRRSSADLKKYKTLPPIRNNMPVKKPASRSREERRKAKEAKRLWRKPKPPSPCLLHFCVTARSHSLEEFQNNFLPDFPKYFINRQLKSTATKYETSDSSSSSEEEKKPEEGFSFEFYPLSAISVQEREVVTDTLITVIRGLLDDVQFHQAIAECQSEPIPYYSQFWSEESAQAAVQMLKNERSLQSSNLAPTQKDEQESVQNSEGTDLTSLQPDSAEGKENLLTIIKEQQQQQEMKEKVKRLPAFGKLMHSILENTIKNVIFEASRGEVILTARPRVIALPPSTSRVTTATSKRTTPLLSQNAAPMPKVIGVTDGLQPHTPQEPHKIIQKDN
ncbi:cilia- and flagella-associated protein 65 [Protopterus annectens]|uniref:cilia- and flagella-associated protein 65 n=1 Tax=Protopterus annectens TaxID=7888 RepID=UPI001CFAC309|nr:cilia- and flagella-associated protein 65 [Protopterus annectens]